MSNKSVFERNRMKSLLHRQPRVLGVLAVLGLSVSLGLLAAPSWAIDGPPPGTISTQGHGEVKVRPDSLNVSVTVESRETTLAAARAENNRKAQTIIAALKGLNIPGLKLETQNLSVYPVQDYQQKGKLPRIIGYQATNSLQVTVVNASSDTLGDYGSRIVDTALNSGANNVGGLNFYVTDMAAPRKQALVLAVKDAQGNADAMAHAAGLTLNGVYSLEGTPQFGGYPRPMMYSMKVAAGAADQEVAAPVEVGETTVTSDVTARFKF
jgi:uncharacterized protein YggE